MTTSPTHLSDIDLAKIRRFAEGRIPQGARHQVRLDVEVRGSIVEIIERRAPWSPTIGPGWTSYPIAQLRFSPTTHGWSLYWRDADQHWHHYEVGPFTHVDPLLIEIEADPMGRFCG